MAYFKILKTQPTIINRSLISLAVLSTFLLPASPTFANVINNTLTKGEYTYQGDTYLNGKPYVKLKDSEALTLKVNQGDLFIQGTMNSFNLGKDSLLTITANNVYFKNTGIITPDSRSAVVFNADKVVFNGGTSGINWTSGPTHDVIVNGALEFTGNFSEMPVYTNSGGSYKPEAEGGSRNIKARDGIFIHDVVSNGAIQQWNVNFYTPSIVIENSTFDMQSEYGAVMMMMYSFTKGEEGKAGIGDITIRHNKVSPGGGFGMAMGAYLEGGLTDINSFTVDDLTMMEGHSSNIVGLSISTEAQVKLNQLTLSNIHGIGADGEAYGLWLANDNRPRFDPTHAEVKNITVSSITSDLNRAVGIFNDGATDKNNPVKITLQSNTIAINNITGQEAAGYIGTKGSSLETKQINISQITANDGEAVAFQTADTKTTIEGTMVIDDVNGGSLATGLALNGGEIAGTSLAISSVHASSQNGESTLIDAQAGAKVTFSEVLLTKNRKNVPLAYSGEYSGEAKETSNIVRDVAIRSLSGADVRLTDKNGTYNIAGTIFSGRDAKETSTTGGSVNIDGKKVSIFGDVYAVNGGVINISLNSGSQLEGQIDDYHDLNTVKNGTVFKNSSFTIGEVVQAGQATLSLNGGQWTAHGKNFINNLDFGTGGGLVDLSKNDNSSVFINKLSGSGQFTMRLDNDPTKSDMLYIQDMDNKAKYQVNVVLNDTVRSVYELTNVRVATTNGNHQNWNDNITAVIADQGINNVEFTMTKEAYNKNDASNALINGKGDGAGTYKPGETVVNEIFGSQDSTNWVIASTEIKDPGDEPSTPDKPNKPSTSLSDAGNALLATARGTYWTAVEIDRLTNRMGDARYADNGDSGLWIRLRQSRIGTDTGEGDFKSKNTTYQVGYDYAIEKDYGRQLLGLAFDYMDTDLDYKEISGEGNTDRYSVSAYSTWLADNGVYVDVLAKWGRLSNDFNIMNSSGGNVKVDYDNNMWAISTELGRKLSDPKTGMFIEPNAQLQYTLVTDAQYKTSQGTSVDQENIDSLIGRMGVRIGRTFGETNANSFYFKADLSREFFGEQKIRVKDKTTQVAGDTIKVQNKGFWFDIGSGLQAQFGKNSYAYTDIEYRFGNDLDRSWLVNVGARYEF